MPTQSLHIETGRSTPGYREGGRLNCKSLARRPVFWIFVACGLLALIAIVAYQTVVGRTCFFWSVSKTSCKLGGAHPKPQYSSDQKPDTGKKPLYGVCYSSWRVFGQCPSAEEVHEDIAILRRFSSRVRTYGTGCPVEMDILLNESTHAEDFKLFLGVWLDGDEKADQSQIDDLLEALDKHPHARIVAIAVGNEVLFRGALSRKRLVQRIREVRAAVRRLGEKHASVSLLEVPITTVETVLHINEDLAKELDLVAVNIHPFFGRSNLAQSKKFGDEVLLDFLGVYGRIEKIANRLGKKVLVSEVGWPTSAERGERNQGDSELTKAFIKTFISYAQEQGIRYFWFELFDSVWKRNLYGGKSEQFSEFNLGLVEENHRDDKMLLDFGDSS
ncbi:hypothetical protein BSKO_07705 [Bryopsis sp. KO-2023]|nr:hypothetical protein BSKO_07705 [Bryopsis sp. KO-2023]